MTSLRGAVAALLCLLAWATPAAAQQAPLGGGAWSWFGDPRAVHHGGKTFVGWVDIEGDIKVMSYDHATDERVTAVLQARLNQDDHANPSIHVRPDGHLVVFYSRHGDVTEWEEPRTVPVNVAGQPPRGYTYPNPVRLEAEERTYLFWRGGNYNPTFSTQNDGSGDWTPARNLILMPGERPYVKYASNGVDTIHVAYTNAHPAEFAEGSDDVNIYYARIRGERIQRADDTDLGPLGEPIHPYAGDEVFNPGVPTWVHDVAADSMGRPVVVFASFPNDAQHRYHYARWTGSAWQVEDIVLDAGESFREERRSPDYYSGGLTLDHEDPSRVYLSRQDNANRWLVEVWTRNGPSDWSSAALSMPDLQPNVRPVSPRGMSAFDEDLNVIWMNGAYPNYEEYETSITALTNDANQPPVADAEPAIRSGPAPLTVRFDDFSYDPDGDALSRHWDFGDGTGASGAGVSHTYTERGRYFPKLTVSDGASSSTLVEEIAVGVSAPPTVHTGGAAGTTAHGAVDPNNGDARWYFEYGPTNRYGARTPEHPLPGDDSLHQVSTTLPGLVAGRLYHYRLVASNATGSSEGEDRVMVAGSAPGTDAYRDAVLATPGLAAYWRLGELSGNASREERGGDRGAFTGRFVLGQMGVLGQLGDTAASFDGVSGERVGPGPALGPNGTMEGWFRWRAGTAVMRDNTGPSRGWLLAFNNGGTLRYRVGGTGFDTTVPIEDVRDGTWHHLAATKDGGAARLYLDGEEIHSGVGAAADTPALPWHVMRNGTNAVFSEGEADEIALYDRPLTAGQVRTHYDLALALAARPLPPEPPDPGADPPAAGTGLGGGVLGSGAGLPLPQPAGKAFVRDARLVVRGAPGTRNRLTARRRGGAWRIADAEARLRAGAGCRRLGPRTVSCRAAGVRRIVMYGGAGADRLTLVGRKRAVLYGGPGADRLVGGPLTRFRGGPGPDRFTRRR